MWSSLKVRNSCGRGSLRWALTLLWVLPSGTPSGSLDKGPEKILWLLQGEGKRKHCEIHPELSL